MGPFVAAAGLALQAVGLVTGIMGKKSAQKQQQRQFDESNALRRESEAKSKQLADIQTMRAKRAAAREAQIRRADVISTAEARGAAVSSPVTGALGSMATQTGANISFLDTANKLQGQAASLFGQAQETANRPIFQDAWGAGVASFGGSLFRGSDKIANIFESVSGSSPAPIPDYQLGL